MTQPRFRADKATQVAATIIERCGGRISVLKLVKLMYLVERHSLDSFGRPVFYDTYYSLPNGPIVSTSLNLIDSEASAEDAVLWDQHISERIGHNVSLSSPLGLSTLSRADQSIVDEVFEEFGHKSAWELRDYTHTLPEWTDPDGTRLPLSCGQILSALGKPDDMIQAIQEELDAVSLADEVLG